MTFFEAQISERIVSLPTIQLENRTSDDYNVLGASLRGVKEKNERSLEPMRFGIKKQTLTIPLDLTTLRVLSMIAACITIITCVWRTLSARKKENASPTADVRENINIYNQLPLNLEIPSRDSSWSHPSPNQEHLYDEPTPGVDYETGINRLQQPQLCQSHTRLKKLHSTRV